MDVETQNNKQTVLDIGQALVIARESKNLSAKDIATQMNLSLLVIEKIEANQFKQDIPLAFIRGYLRSYANKVNADVETLSVEFDRQTGLDNEPIQKLRVVSNFKSSRKEVNSNNLLFKLISFIMIISLLGFAGWEAWKRYVVAAQYNAAEVNQISLNLGTTNTDQNSDASLDEVNENLGSKIELDLSGQAELNEQTDLNEQADLDGQVINEEDNAAVSEADEIIANSESNSVNQAPQVTINKASAKFVFSEDCWVNITDVNGEVLASGVKKSGYVMTINGVTPFNVILGKPAAVSVTFEDKNFDLSGFRADRRAEFKLESSN